MGIDHNIQLAIVSRHEGMRTANGSPVQVVVLLPTNSNPIGQKQRCIPPIIAQI